MEAFRTITLPNPFSNVILNHYDIQDTKERRTNSLNWG